MKIEEKDNFSIILPIGKLDTLSVLKFDEKLSTLLEKN